MKPIFRQVLISFLFIILLNLVITTIIEYYTYTRELPGLITEVRTKSIAASLSSAYTRDRNWENLNSEVRRLMNLDSLNTLEDANLRIIIKDKTGKTIYNSFLEITSLSGNELIEGKTQPIIDFMTGEAAGIVTIYIGRAYIMQHSKTYIYKLIKSGIYKGLLTAVIAVILSILLSRRITRPVIRLTRAVQLIAQNEESSPLPLKDENSSAELSRLGLNFNKMLEALQSQQQMRKKLVADISHEINTPLNTIRLEARGLTDGLVSSMEAGHIIITEIDKLKKVIYDLDWLAETDIGTYSLKKERTSVSRLLNDEIKRWQHRACTRQIALVLQESSEILAELHIDAVKISTALDNLIENAIKYSPSGSVITIKYTNSKSYIKITVCDEGSSISEAQREKIFERFYRTEDETQSQGEGRGLGLSIVKNIIELHGGSVELEPGMDSGNCFSVFLPKEI